jgi:hypothetical protein
MELVEDGSEPVRTYEAGQQEGEREMATAS